MHYRYQKTDRLEEAAQNDGWNNFTNFAANERAMRFGVVRRKALDCLTLSDWLADCLTDGQSDWLTDWLSDWFAFPARDKDGFCNATPSELQELFYFF